MMSDVCKHCVQAGCLEVCPTGAIIRTEFDTVVIQADVCNGCRDCIAACPFGVIEIYPVNNTAQKCTLCYDRLQANLTPACAQACPTQSIQFGKIDDLKVAAQKRVEQLHANGETDAYLYGADETFLGGLNSFYLLVDKPEVYGLPENPKLPSRNLWPSSGWRCSAPPRSACSASSASAAPGWVTTAPRASRSRPHPDRRRAAAARRRIRTRGSSVEVDQRSMARLVILLPLAVLGIAAGTALAVDRIGVSRLALYLIASLLALGVALVMICILRRIVTWFQLRAWHRHPPSDDWGWSGDGGVGGPIPWLSAGAGRSATQSLNNRAGSGARGRSRPFSLPDRPRWHNDDDAPGAPVGVPSARVLGCPNADLGSAVLDWRPLPTRS
jgi:ferredoxin